MQSHHFCIITNHNASQYHTITLHHITLAQQFPSRIEPRRGIAGHFLSRAPPARGWISWRRCLLQGLNLVKLLCLCLLLYVFAFELRKICLKLRSLLHYFCILFAFAFALLSLLRCTCFRIAFTFVLLSLSHCFRFRIAFAFALL
jgi:hypothetical protein